MNLILGGIIATSTIIFLGVLLVSPVFLIAEKPTPVMLSFSLYDQSNLEIWCKELSEWASSKNIKGSIFLSGEVAEKYPSCITLFPKSFDVGSQTYSYVQLNQINDYSVQLEEVQKGRESINKVGNLDSKLFKAPYGETDDNIYSILNRNEILADFSYQNQYNKFHNNQFLKFDLVTYDSHDVSNNIKDDVELSEFPIQIEFNSFQSITEIKKIVNEIQSWNIEFESASDVSNLELTRRI